MCIRDRKKINPASSDSNWVTYSALESILSDIESAIEMGNKGVYIRVGDYNTVRYNPLPNSFYWHRGSTGWEHRFPVLVEEYDFVVAERLTDTMKIFLIGPIFIHRGQTLRRGHSSRAGYNYSAESKKVLKYWGEPVGAFLQWNTGSDYPPLCSRESYSFAL